MTPYSVAFQGGRIDVTPTDRRDTLSRRVYEWEVRSFALGTPTPTLLASGELPGPDDGSASSPRLIAADLISSLVAACMAAEERTPLLAWAWEWVDILASTATAIERGDA